MSSEEARKAIGDLSKENIDQRVRPASLSNELEEACTGLGKKMNSKQVANEAYSLLEGISIRN